MFFSRIYSFLSLAHSTTQLLSLSGTLRQRTSDFLLRSSIFRLSFLLTVLFSLLLLTYPALVRSATYYVDATNGKDTNTGLSEAAAWKTIAKVNASRFSPGDQILLKRGEIWREQLTVPSSGSSENSITFGAYGSGTPPIITGSDLITGWTQVSSTNVYQAACAWTAALSYQDGARRTFKTWNTDIATTNLAEGQWTLDTTNHLVYVYATGGVDPDTFSSPGMEIGARASALDMNDKSWLTFDGIIFRDANSQPVIRLRAITVGIVIKNCTVERGRGQGIFSGGSTTATSITIQNCIIQNNGQWGILGNYEFTSGEISACTITGNGWMSVADNQQIDGIGAYLGNFNVFNNTIHDNTVVANAAGLSHGIYAYTTAAVANIYQNTIYNHANGSGIKSRGSANIYRNKIYGNGYAGIMSGGNGATNVVYTIYDNFIYNNNVAHVYPGILEVTKGAGTLTLSIYNNTLYNDSGTGDCELEISDNLTVLNIKNNIFNTTDTRRTVNVHAQTGTVAINNNFHWRADGNPNIYYAGANHTWAQWQAHGYDTAGVLANPLFVSASIPDFHLQPASPAIDAATRNLHKIRPCSGHKHYSLFHA